MKHLDITFKRGTTFKLSVLWESAQIRYRQITAVAQTAPVRISAPGHGIPDGWPVAIVNVVGPAQINAPGNPLRDTDFRPVTVVSADAFEISEVNGAAFPAYRSGGQAVYYEPTSLLGVNVRMLVRRTPGGPVLFEASTALGTITLDLPRSRIEVEVPTELIDAFEWRAGIHELIAEDAAGIDTLLLHGCTTVAP